MARVRPSPGDLGVLEAVGVTAVEERVYRVLLGEGTATVEDVARAEGLTRDEAAGALVALEGMGLASHSATKPPRYSPAPPDLAVEVLILRRQEQLERARLAANQLAEEFQAGGERQRPRELVEIISGRDASMQRFTQMQRSASREILLFDKPPYAHPEPNAVNEDEVEVLRRKVAYRVVYDRSVLELPGRIASLEAEVALGEEARIHPEVPMKLVIADRHFALIPFQRSEESIEGAVLLYPSAIVDALVVLFESLWEKATPFLPGQQGEVPTTREARAEPADERVLALLAAGLQDQAIARQLDIGLSTVARRVKRILDSFGAGTRFQAGYQAGYRAAREEPAAPGEE